MDKGSPPPSVSLTTMFEKGVEINSKIQSIMKHFNSTQRMGELIMFQKWERMAIAIDQKIKAMSANPFDPSW